MKRIVLGLAATTCLLLAGCGAGPNAQGTPPSSTGGSTGQAGVTGNTVSSNATSNQVAANTPGPTHTTLQPFTGFTTQGIAVDVPAGWNKATTTGGDYIAVTFTNPQDHLETVRVVYSTCVGCYMNPSGQPDPRLVIGEKNPTNVQVQGTGGLIATYDFPVSGSTYLGKGMVQVSNNQSGYAELDIAVGPQHQTLLNSIIKSFNYSS